MLFQGVRHFFSSFDHLKEVVERHQIAFLILYCTLLAAVFNYRFTTHLRYRTIVKMNDVNEIIAGYHRSPTISIAFHTYLSKPWIQINTYCFRPIAGCQYWVETYIGLHYGFLWDALFGFALYVCCCVLAGLIAYRLTQSKLASLISAALCCFCRLYNAGSPDYWLAWYPVHQDILMIASLLGAVYAFDVWFERQTMGLLLAAWACFLFGSLTKEYVYVFPLYMGVIALFRPAATWQRRLSAIQQSVLALGVVGGLMTYRQCLFVHPRDPHFFRAGVVLHKPLLFMYNVFGRRLIAHDSWFVGLSLIVTALIGLGIFLHARRSRVRLGLLGKPYIWAPITIALIAGYFWLTLGSPLTGFWFIFDESETARSDLFAMACLLYTMALVVKYWRLPGTIPAYLFLFLSYLPVISYTGWHYTLPGAIMRGPYWGVLSQLFWRDTAGLREEFMEHWASFKSPRVDKEPPIQKSC